LLLLLAGCDSQDLYNSQNQKQATTEADAKIAALQPAVGRYCGKMHMIESDQDYDTNLSLQVVQQNIHSSTSQDPTDTVRVPMLAGSLRFPAIDAAGSDAYSTLPDLVQATGGYGAVSFSYGDYNPLNQSLNLPFAVNGQAPGVYYGTVTGTLDGGAFTGQWYSESSRLVGSFTLTKCQGQAT
jgi:hypothetical protein